MKKYTLDEARIIAMSCAKQYKQLLQDKKFLILYRDQKTKEIKYLEVLFLDQNYQHLTGLELIDEDGALLEHRSKDFYRKCVSNQLKKTEFRFKPDGTTHLKLAALGSITKIHSITKIAGDYNNGKPRLYADKVIGGVNFCMGLIKEAESYAPISALLEDIKKVTSTPSQVLAIFSKEKNDTIYKNIRHVAKGLNLTHLYIPADINLLISLEKYLPKES